MTTTISLIDQLRASRAIYAKALENIESLDDQTLHQFLAGTTSASTVARVLDLASDSTMARVLAVTSDSTMARVLAVTSDSTMARVLDMANNSTMARVLDMASDSTVARVLAVASDSTVARVLDMASDSTVARINLFTTLQVPIVQDLDQRVAEAAKAGKLGMSTWHCGTTHCRAGLAVVFGGTAGAKLEQALGSETAGRLIYEASTGRPAPDFYADQDAAMEDIRRCATEAIP